jgi:hypothetical protein
LSYDEAEVLSQITGVIHKKCIETARSYNIQIVTTNEEMNIKTIIHDRIANENFFFIVSSSDKKTKNICKMNESNENNVYKIEFNIFGNQNIIKKLNAENINKIINSELQYNTKININSTNGNIISLNISLEVDIKLEILKSQNTTGKSQNTPELDAILEKEIRLKQALHDYIFQISSNQN